MEEQIRAADVYDKHLNFLIGSGASYGLFPTLSLNIRDKDGHPQTIETLATLFERTKARVAQTLLFMHYYTECIRPVCQFVPEMVVGDVPKERVLLNYEILIETMIRVIDRRRPQDKRCNVFTTNYDGCFEIVAERILQRGTNDFLLNDGTRGFQKKILQARNFGSYLFQSGVFDQHQTSVPQINLLHLHGSVYWQKDASNICVDYSPSGAVDIVPASAAAKLAPFSECLTTTGETLDDLPVTTLQEKTCDSFWDAYERLPVVNPTKWKFHETVFEEHYYQMLRLLSYELERPNAILITFGFSFADEHILNLVRRSLSNPRLQVFVCCFDAAELARMTAHFGQYRNVKCIVSDKGNLDFSAFNESVFTLTPTAA